MRLYYLGGDIHLNPAQVIDVRAYTGEKDFRTTITMSNGQLWFTTRVPVEVAYGLNEAMHTHEPPIKAPDVSVHLGKEVASKRSVLDLAKRVAELEARLGGGER